MLLHYLGNINPGLFTHAGYSPRPPTWSYRTEILHGGWSSVDSSEFRISSKSFKRFRNRGVEICPFPAWEMANVDRHGSETALASEFSCLRGQMFLTLVEGGNDASGECQ